MKKSAILILILILGAAALSAQSAVDFRNLDFLHGRYQRIKVPTPSSLPDLGKASSIELSSNPNQLIFTLWDTTQSPEIRTAREKLRISRDGKRVTFLKQKWEVYELNLEKGENWFEISMQSEEAKMDIWGDGAEFSIQYEPWEGGKPETLIFDQKVAPTPVLIKN